MGISKGKILKSLSARGHFTIIPNEIWEVQELDWIGKVIWCYLYSQPRDWDSSRNNVAKNLGMCAKTVSNYVKQLESLGMLKVHFGARSSWHFEINPPDEWTEGICPQWSYKQKSTEGTMPPDLGVPDPHIQEDKKLNTILKEEKPKPERKKKSEQPLVKKKKDEPVPEELMDYHLVLKSVGLHLKFKEYLPQIKEVWPEYELFQSFLAQRKEFYEKTHDIKENFHKFRAVISKAIKEELGV